MKIIYKKLIKFTIQILTLIHRVNIVSFIKGRSVIEMDLVYTTN